MTADARNPRWDSSKSIHTRRPLRYSNEHPNQEISLARPTLVRLWADGVPESKISGLNCNGTLLASVRIFMNPLRKLVLCIAALGVWAGESQAAPITLEMTGMVTGIAGVLGPSSGFAAGDSVTWRLTYDPVVATEGPPGAFTFTAGLPATSFDWSVTVAGLVYRWSNVGVSRLLTDDTGTQLGMDTSISGLAVDGPALSNPFPLFPLAFDAGIQFAAAVAPPFTLPGVVPHGPVTGGFSLMFAPCDNCAGPSIGFVNGVFENIRQVPEPSSLLLVVLGAVGLRKWRKSQRASRA
jgi:hypothetical protein